MYNYTRLRHMREDSDTSQIQLAEYLKIDQRTYSNYETGKREIPVHLLIRLAQYYGVSLDYLVGLSDR